VLALGVDVSVARGLDLVLLDDSLRVVDTRPSVDVDALGGSLDDLRPDAVAIDSPPAWGTRGSSRRTERELRLFGIQSYGTPTRERDGHPFYSWMKVGFRAFEIARRRGYRRYGSGSPKGTAMEVFPHATAVVLAGCLPPRGARKREWRRAVLENQGVATGTLQTTDQIDAALAALTGIRALAGRMSALGDPEEGVIVLPSNRLPAQPYRRAEPAMSSPLALIPSRTET
jgi:predicted nuclease with RNAse H fold